jgi:hypothetical protein
VGADDHVEVVLLEEAFHPIGTEFDYISGLRGVS